MSGTLRLVGSLTPAHLLLRALRRVPDLRGLTQEALAECIGVSRSTVNYWDRNGGVPTAPTKNRIAKRPIVAKLGGWEWVEQACAGELEPAEVDSSARVIPSGDRDTPYAHARPEEPSPPTVAPPVERPGESQVPHLIALLNDVLSLSDHDLHFARFSIDQEFAKRRGLRREPPNRNTG
jgi:transcriptional regulator with XRE-family HTH domain